MAPEPPDMFDSVATALKNLGLSEEQLNSIKLSQKHRDRPMDERLRFSIMSIKAARHGVRDRSERFRATLDPGVKTSSRLHHARCGAARCDRIAANRRYAGSCWRRCGRGLRVDRRAERLPRKSSINCRVRTNLQQRQVGSRRPSPKALENQWLIRLACIVLRSMVAQHRSGDRFRLACHAL